MKKTGKIERKAGKKSGKKVLGLVLLGILVATAVGVGLVQFNRHLAFLHGKELTGQILEYEEPMRKYFAEGVAEDFDDTEKVENLVAEGEELMGIIDLSNELRKDGVICANERLEICDALGEDTANFSIAFQRSRVLLSWFRTGEISEEDLAFLSESEGKMGEMVGKLTELQAKVVEFKEKYPLGAEIDENIMITEYGEIYERIEALQKEAKAATFEEVYGVSEEGLFRIFETVEALNTKI